MISRPDLSLLVPEDCRAKYHRLKMRYHCGSTGEQCFNVCLRPKIEVFGALLPDNFAFTDVDGLLEVNGYGLLLEWKSNETMPTGQSIMFKRFTATGIFTVVCLVGNARTMDVESFCYFKFGKRKPATKSGWAPMTLKEIQDVICLWVKNADTRKRPIGIVYDDGTTSIKGQ